jgi:hypothetical protein
MRSFVITALAAITSLAAPAGAQFAPGPTAPSDPRPRAPMVVRDATATIGVWRDIGDIRDRIDRGRESGAISKREARQLRREARLIDALGQRYADDGLSDSERRELDARALYLRDAVGVARAGE